MALVLVLLALLAVAIRCAWLGDDAYITLRSVENWVAGNGLRWNPGDRVQTYTHPAWMLLLSAGRWLTGELYLTTIVVSLLLSMGAAAMLLARAATTAALVACGVALLTTRAFTDYMTSGLETPLTFVLLAAFTGVVLREDQAPVRRFALSVLLASLAATTRMDLALLCAPAVLASMRGVPWRMALRVGAAASLPFLVWLAIATFWYGSPLPVTAHAKAFGIGIPAADLAAQGLRYLQFALTDDPVLVAMVAAGLGLGLATRPTRWLALGGVLYLGYVVKVGGDFMAGRFLLPPFLLALAVLAPWLSRRKSSVAVGVAAVAVVLCAIPGVPQWLHAPAHDQAPTEAELEAQWGICDERRVYYAQLGLLSPTRAIPQFGGLHAIVRPGGGDRWINLNGAVGVAGFHAGANGHILDPLLCDPLLTRLPAENPTKWRIGHVMRRVPEGYYETIATGENRLHHPGLAAYYNALRTLTSAPVGSGDRIDALWQMTTGAFDAGFREFVATDYRNPPRLPVAYGKLPPPLPLGTYWFDEPRVTIVYEGGLAIPLSAPRRARQVLLQAQGLHGMRLRFLRDGVVRGEVMAAAEPPPPGLHPLRVVAGLRQERAEVPAAVGEFDAVWIDAVITPLTHTAPCPPAVGAMVFDS